MLFSWVFSNLLVRMLIDCTTTAVNSIKKYVILMKFILKFKFNAIVCINSESFLFKGNGISFDLQYYTIIITVLYTVLEQLQLTDFEISIQYTIKQLITMNKIKILSASNIAKCYTYKTIFTVPNFS